MHIQLFKIYFYFGPLETGIRKPREYQAYNKILSLDTKIGFKIPLLLSDEHLNIYENLQTLITNYNT